MLFGLPWWAIIPIVAIVGGLIYSYKEKELELESKRMGTSKEIHELRKNIHNLKTRIEKLEGRPVASQKSTEKSVPLDDIEIKDEYYSENQETTSQSKVKN